MAGAVITTGAGATPINATGGAGTAPYGPGVPTPQPALPAASTWQAKLLTGLGAPVSTEGVNALTAWANSEGTTWANNPLAICCGGPGAVSCIAQCGSNSPIMSYDTIDHGIAATVRFLSAQSYKGVVQAFQQQQGYKSIWQEINRSGWCRGCQGGKYPVGLYQLAGSPPPAGTLINESGSQGAQGSTQQATLTAADTTASEHCIISGPSAGVGPVNFGTGCILGTPPARALAGAGLVGAGVLLMLAGLGIIIANGLADSKLGAAAGVAFGSGPVGFVAGGVSSAAKAPGRRRANRREAAAEAQGQANAEGAQSAGFKGNRYVGTSRPGPGDRRRFEAEPANAFT